MKVLFIMNGLGAVDGLPGISGGDVRWIEIAKRWQKAGHDVHVLTPEAGVELCRKLGLNTTFHILAVPNDYSLKTYLLRFVKSTYIPKTLENFHGVVYSTTEHVYDVRPAAKIKKNGTGNIWVAIVHWVAPLKRKGTSWLNSMLFFLNQQMGFWYIKKGADLVLAVSRITAE
ncbi:MAG: glycosyltransferase, partial [Candidatus Jordarchaeaceae archaeon]